MITGGARLQANGVRVSDMNDIMNSVFDISGGSSQASINGAVFSNNDLRGGNSQWNAIVARDAASVNVQGTSFMDNYQLHSVVSSLAGSTVSVSSLAVNTMTGTAVLVRLCQK